MSTLSFLTSGEGSAASPESHCPVQRAAAAEGVVPVFSTSSQSTRQLVCKKMSHCLTSCVFLQWSDFLKMGEDMTDQELNAVIGSLRANECCTLIYTSGTTGNPKGVMLSHDNVSTDPQLSCSRVYRCLWDLPRLNGGRIPSQPWIQNFIQKLCLMLVTRGRRKSPYDITEGGFSKTCSRKDSTNKIRCIWEFID